MICCADHKTLPLFDSWAFLGPRRRRLLEQSWASLFQKELLCELPVDKLATLFCPGMGRPTKELYTVLGALTLQQMFDLTDEETVSHLAFNMEWHYALNLSGESDVAKYLAPKTLWNMRRLVIDNNLDSLLFAVTTDKLAKVFSVDTSRQRLDSVHIRSNMRRLGRISIIARCISRFLINLRRQERDLFALLDVRFVQSYLVKNSQSLFSMVKPSESAKTLASVSADLHELTERFKGHDRVSAMSSYKLLVRVLSEQCTVVSGEDGTVRVTAKAPKDVSSDSLQNPSDPDATYDGHKGQGYQVQVAETWCPDKKPDTLNLLTHIEVEQAHESDANALEPAIESTTARNLAPTVLLADTLYGSDTNCTTAANNGVTLIAPAMGSGQDGKLSLADFTIEAGTVTHCPAGHEPVRHKQKKNRFSVAFASRNCLSCPHAADCPAKPGKQERHYLRYDVKALRLAIRRKQEKQPEFTEVYRYRSGIEGTMSQYDRKTGVKRLRVRGLPAVRYAATLKAVAVNIFRASVAQRARNAEKERSEVAQRPNTGLFIWLNRLKEQLLGVCFDIEANCADSYRRTSCLAA